MCVYIFIGLTVYVCMYVCEYSCSLHLNLKVVYLYLRKGLFALDVIQLKVVFMGTFIVLCTKICINRLYMMYYGT